MMIWLDAPKHTTLRKLVSRAFTMRRIATLETKVREVCVELLDAQVGSGRFDYVQDFSAILPPSVISLLLGVPASERDELRHIVDNVFHTEEGVGMANEVSMNALVELGQRLGAHFADRRLNPRDDVFTDLVNAEVADELTGEPRRLTDEELAGFGILLFSAGSETVARHLGWAASLLDEHPAQRAELGVRPIADSRRGRGDPALRAAFTGKRPLVDVRRHRGRRDDSRRLPRHPYHRVSRKGRAEISESGRVRHPPQRSTCT